MYLSTHKQVLKTADKGGDQMENNKQMKLKNKLFFIILLSMIMTLICMGCVFIVLTGRIQDRSERSLSAFSDEMVSLFREDEKASVLDETGKNARLLAYISKNNLLKHLHGIHTCCLTGSYSVR